MIKPAFKAAAYANGFYKFYKLYNSTPVGKNVTTDLNLLSVPVDDHGIHHYRTCSQC
jgi:hypothetical protein